MRVANGVLQSHPRGGRRGWNYSVPRAIDNPPCRRTNAMQNEPGVELRTQRENAWRNPVREKPRRQLILKTDCDCVRLTAAGTPSTQAPTFRNVVNACSSFANIVTWITCLVCWRACTYVVTTLTLVLAACAVCDKWTMPTLATAVPLPYLAQTGMYKTLKQRCSNCEVPLSEQLRRAYTVPDERLRGILLSPRGVVMDPDGGGAPVAALHMCPSCQSSLTDNKLPECAIANGLAIGMHRDHGPTFDVDHPVHGRQTMRWSEIRTAEFSGNVILLFIAFLST